MLLLRRFEHVHALLEQLAFGRSARHGLGQVVAQGRDCWCQGGCAEGAEGASAEAKATFLRGAHIKEFGLLRVSFPKEPVRPAFAVALLTQEMQQTMALVNQTIGVKGRFLSRLRCWQVPGVEGLPSNLALLVLTPNGRANVTHDVFQIHVQPVVSRRLGASWRQHLEGGEVGEITLLVGAVDHNIRAEEDPVLSTTPRHCPAETTRLRRNFGEQRAHGLEGAACAWDPAGRRQL
mmetsp:Transcript_8706/g.24313  ORF Transcript_8706/g.24313 Transcript_8706/m.24313 type:complete len:235 (+) Transcript_8706:2000-2704(+)